MILAAYSLRIDDKKPVNRIAFGSCNNMFRQRNPQLYNSIVKWNPDLFVWLGDTVYADTLSFPLRSSETKESQWRGKYTSFKTTPEYTQLMNSTMITGVWDDHDYGINDGTKHFKSKAKGKELFLEFLDDGSVRDHEGVYHSFTFPDLKLILIDIRWFRDYRFDPDGDSLGEEQWAWLESELKSFKGLKIIGNGLQVNTEDRSILPEKWHEKSRLRFLELVDRYPGVILLSGDVHYSEIMRIDCGKHIFYEITASGMTHSVATAPGPIFWFFLNIWNGFTYNVSPKYRYKNFGTIEYNVEEQWIEFSIRNSDGVADIAHKIPISELYEQNDPPAHCSESPSLRGRKHLASAFLVFVVPFLLHTISFLIFLKKYTRSY